MSRKWIKLYGVLALLLLLSSDNGLSLRHRYSRERNVRTDIEKKESKDNEDQDKKSSINGE